MQDTIMKEAQALPIFRARSVAIGEEYSPPLVLVDGETKDDSRSEHLPLSVSPAVRISRDAATRINKLQEFDMQFLEEQLTWKDGYGDALAYECVTEYKKWIALHIAMHDPDFITAHFSSERLPLGMPSRYIDNAWHRHILFTWDYVKFCEFIAGRMIHHNPCTRQNVARMNANATRKAYRILFGEMPEIWNTGEGFLVNANSSGCGCGCSSRD